MAQPILDAFSSSPGVLQDMFAHMTLKSRELRLGSDGAQAAILIGGMNVAIWLAWKVPRLRPFMRAHFTHDPLSGKVHTMLTSMFSQRTLLDIGMCTLLLFTPLRVVSMWMEKEQDQRGHLHEGRSMYHALAFFISANLFSSLFFHLTAARVLYPRMVKQLAQNTSKSRTGTGAGTPQTSFPRFSGPMGAIYASLTIAACMFPEAPMYPPQTSPSIPFAYVMGGVVLFDIIGALRGWRIFEHYTHLGGAMFGLLYWVGGAQLWEWTRRHVWGEKPGENESSAKKMLEDFTNPGES
ncbi:hypothetical protein DENSPDRAFT_845984 [Dentipellis sp. KUC8613]|nr:hypothetical protein DENSPDRAFT_845984 [Dentipellis sp. KUC8613]